MTVGSGAVEAPGRDADSDRLTGSSVAPRPGV